MKTTYKKTTKHGDMSGKGRDDLPNSAFAFPDKRKEPLTDASHVRAALARFDQTKGVSDEERERAFKNIKKAAKAFGVDLPEKSWRDLGKHPHTKNPSSSSSSHRGKSSHGRSHKGK